MEINKAIDALKAQADGDTVSRQAAADAVCMAGCGSEFCGVECDEVLAIRKLPSAHPEIATCIDCIHYTPLGKDKAWGRCYVHSSPTENQRMCQSCDFCSWAERRTDEGD